MRLPNVQIPADCTHWEKLPSVIQGQPPRYRFYKVFGRDNDIVYTKWQGRWVSFGEYQSRVLEHTPARLAPRMPDFNHRCFNRHAETANDKIKRVAEKLKQQTTGAQL